MVLLLFPLVTTQTVSRPWLWALPFLFTFVGGVFADALETRQRKMFLALTGGDAGGAGGDVPDGVAGDRAVGCRAGSVCGSVRPIF